jgi:class 3 adenylate cyclase/alpha-beta hydrolase superfamily lysophospholipase
MEQQIRFCTTSDGVRIAYATVGEGPPLVYACGWPGHLELEWERPFVRDFLETLAAGSTLIRYDMRGSGLSDRDAADLTLAGLTRDMEAVVDHLALERFALLGLGVLAGPVAISYAAAQPERVAQLILYSAYVRGDKLATPKIQQTIVDVAGTFGFPQFDVVDHPDVDIEQQRYIRELDKIAASPGTQAALLKMMFSVDVSDLLDHLTMPALIMHGRGDPLIRFELGRELAARLPQAKFVPFEGGPGPIWVHRNVLIPEIRRFLGVRVATQEPVSVPAAGPLTILFTDVEGSTALTQRLGDAKAREVLRAHERIVREALKAHGGSEVKTMGDGFMVSFSSATRALECAIAMQRAFAEHSESAAEPIRVRIGLNAGEPIAEEEDLFGTAVILAARIAAKAEGGEIVASDVVRQLVAGKGFVFADRGETALRGFEEPVRLYEVHWREE